MDLTFFCFDVQTILKKTLENLMAVIRYGFGIDEDVTEVCEHEYAKKNQKTKRGTSLTRDWKTALV